MFEAARELVLRDRAKARKALVEEMARDEADDLDAELDRLADEERQRQEREARERAEAKAMAAASKELREVGTRQHQQAKKFDRALTQASAAFEELEALANQAATLERATGEGDGVRPVVVGHARTGAIVAAVWHAARPLAERLRLSAVPGSRRNFRPLGDLYTKPKEK
ncbi:hypothetical protein NAP1_13598 [Erythrobacter sp. NAP1]|uniref:hypothetical protein n=1 Tax=Erythrobacter sp. NAP1 TaxID=237727 RepID=UPI00006879C8|nr:hypothetical protein [Erythrobacter sp. NAP1]EAQ28637.1 hypothetical protein NAP1_13598 [Erythrobacter sp. NAP1]